MKLSPISTPLPIEYGWLKFYKKPWALSSEDWDIFDAEIKKKHPIQYFFREVLTVKFWACKFILNDYIWKIRHRISNPRKEMRKAVFPARYEDLPEIIFEFNKQVIIEIFEKEKYFDGVKAAPSKSKRGQFEKGLRKYYKYVTQTRQEMLDEVDQIIKTNDELPKNKRNSSWVKKFDKVDKLDNEMCAWIGKHREFFWT